MNNVMFPEGNSTPFTPEMTLVEIDRQIAQLQERRRNALAKQLKGQTPSIFYVAAINPKVAELYMRYLGKDRHQWRYVSNPMYLRGLQEQTLMVVGDTGSIKDLQGMLHQANMKRFTVLYLNDRH